MRPPYIKHALDLRQEDFAEHPIWVCAYNTDLDEPWYEEDRADEATYRPWDGTPPYDCIHGKDRSARVAAVFVFADGTKLHGFCKPPNPAFGAASANLGRMQPAIFWKDRGLWFWIGGADENAMHNVKKATYDALGRNPDQVFPIRYTVPDGLINVEFHGQIDGFGRLLAPEFRRTVVER